MNAVTIKFTWDESIKSVIVPANRTHWGHAYVQTNRAEEPWAVRIAALRFNKYSRGSVVPVIETKSTCPKCGFNELSTFLSRRKYKAVETGFCCPECLEKGHEVILDRIQLRPVVPEAIKAEFKEFRENGMSLWYPATLPRVWGITRGHAQHVPTDSDAQGRELAAWYKRNHKQITPFNKCKKGVDSFIISLPTEINNVEYKSICGDVEAERGPQEGGRGWKLNVFLGVHRRVRQSAKVPTAIECALLGVGLS